MKMILIKFQSVNYQTHLTRLTTSWHLLTTKRIDRNLKEERRGKHLMQNSFSQIHKDIKKEENEFPSPSPPAHPIGDQSKYIIPPSQTEKNWAEKKSN